MVVEAGLPAGTELAVWVDAEGKITSPPRTPGQNVVASVGYALSIWFMMTAMVVGALWAIRTLRDRERGDVWDAEWAEVEPVWSRRDGALGWESERRDMSTPVVVGVHGSPGGRSALRWAASGGSRRALALRVVLAVHAAPSQPSATHGGDDTDDTLRALTQLASSIAPSLSVSSQLLPGHPRSTLTEESRYAALLVLGSAEPAVSPGCASGRSRWA